MRFDPVLLRLSWLPVSRPRASAVVLLSPPPLHPPSHTAGDHDAPVVAVAAAAVPPGDEFIAALTGTNARPGDDDAALVRVGLGVPRMRCSVVRFFSSSVLAVPSITWRASGLSTVWEQDRQVETAWAENAAAPFD